MAEIFYLHHHSRTLFQAKRPCKERKRNPCHSHNPTQSHPHLQWPKFSYFEQERADVFHSELLEVVQGDAQLPRCWWRSWSDQISLSLPSFAAKPPLLPSAAGQPSPLPARTQPGITGNSPTLRSLKHCSTEGEWQWKPCVFFCRCDSLHLLLLF